MKILMTTDTIGGVWTYAMELAAELHNHGIEVALATMGDPPTGPQRRQAHAVGSLGLFESTYKLEWMDDPWPDVQQAGEWLTYLEDVVRPDIIHLNSYAQAAFPFKAPKLVVAHSCVLSWWRAVKSTVAPPEWNEYATTVRAGIAAADAVVAPTRAMMDLLIAHYGEPNRALVIPNGRRPFAGDCRAKWPFILSAGRLWDEAKNVALLEQAAPRLDWPVCLAGETALARSPAHRRRSKVNLLGQLPFNDLIKWFSRAAIYALPARYEPFGLSALEAGLCGCALVLGDIESLREVWGKAALYVSPEDSEGLVGIIQDLITHPEKLNRYGELARERASKYSPQHMAEAYVSLYDKLTAARRSRPPVRETACVS